MSSTVEIPQSEYNDLIKKAKIMESLIDTESLTPKDLDRLKKARLSPSITEADFLNRHPELRD
ncbi:MAG: hypothetical protein V3R86_01295 [Candidatus Hydrothermarchaeaceae archaeon]